MNELETAHDRRLDADLREAFSDDLPQDLEQRVLRRVRRERQTATERAQSSDAKHTRRTGPLLAAASLLLGLGVVFAVANVQDSGTGDGAGASQADPDRQDPKADPQAPATAVLTTESLQDAIDAETLDPAPERGDVVDRLLAIADTPSVNLIVTPVVKGKSNIDLEGRTANEAIELLAAECNVQLSEQRGALIVGSIGQSGRIGQRLTLSTKDEPAGRIPVRTFFRRMHRLLRINVVVSERVRGFVRCEVKDVPWRIAADAVCKQLGLEIVGCGTVLAIRPAEPNGQARLRFRFRDSKVEDILTTWAKIGGKNLIVDDKVQGTLTLRTNDLPLDSLLRAVTDSVYAKAEQQGPNITRVAPEGIHWSTDLLLEDATVPAACKRNGTAAKDIPQADGRSKVSVFVHAASGRHTHDAIDVASVRIERAPDVQKQKK